MMGGSSTPSPQLKTTTPTDYRLPCNVVFELLPLQNDDHLHVRGVREEIDPEAFRDVEGCATVALGGRLGEGGTVVFQSLLVAADVDHTTYRVAATHPSQHRRSDPRTGRVENGNDVSVGRRWRV